MQECGLCQQPRGQGLGQVWVVGGDKEGVSQSPTTPHFYLRPPRTPSAIACRSIQQLQQEAW